MVFKQYQFLIATCVSLSLLTGCMGDKKETSEELYIIDVNSPEQYKDAHIKGAVHSDLTNLENITKNWNKNASVVIYCSNYMCSASGLAVKKLKDLGFKNVRAYEGGMAEWYQLNKNNKDFAFEGTAQDAYLTVEIPKPEHKESDTDVINAEDLQKKMKEAKLL